VAWNIVYFFSFLFPKNASADEAAFIGGRGCGKRNGIGRVCLGDLVETM
jgi:hypothetical protein